MRMENIQLSENQFQTSVQHQKSNKKGTEVFSIFHIY
jgi:hypothetical protein